jgi:hypothetical protein
MSGQDELANIDGPVLPGDVRDDDMEPGSVRKHRVDEWLGEIDPPAGRLQHALDEVAQLPGGQDRGGQLRGAAPCNENSTGLIHPNFFNRGVVEIGLQRSETRDRVVDAPCHLSPIVQRRQRAGQSPFVVLGNDLVDESADARGVGGRIQSTPSYKLTNLVFDDRD